MGKKQKETLEQVLDSMLNVSQPACKLIDRKRIAELAGVLANKIILAAQIPSLGMPRHKAKRGNAFLYDEAEILIWLEKTPLKDMSFSERFIADMGGTTPPSKIELTRLDNKLACAFMRGRYATKWGRRAHDNRMLRARKNQPTRKIVHIKETDNAREALRPGLTPASAPDGVTFASLSGNARQLYY
jgi:hypothetical protein